MLRGRAAQRILTGTLRALAARPARTLAFCNRWQYFTCKWQIIPTAYFHNSHITRCSQTADPVAPAAPTTTVEQIETAATKTPTADTQEPNAVQTYFFRMKKALDEENVEHVFELANELKATGIQPNASIYYILMNAYRKSATPQRALRMFDDMKALGIQPNYHHYHAVLSVCADMGFFKKAEEFYAKAKENKIEVNIALFKLVLISYANAGFYRLLHQRLEDLPKEPVTPDLKFYIFLAELYRRVGQGPEAVRLLTKLEEQRFTLPADLLYTILHACINGRDAEGGLKAFSAVRNVGAALDRGTLLSLLNVAAFRGRVDLAEAVWPIVPKPIVDVRFYHALALTYARKRRIDRGIETLHRMAQAGLPLHAWVVNRVANCARRIEDVDEAYLALERLHTTHGEAVSAGVINVVIQACAAMGDLDRAYQTLKDMHKFGVEPNIGSFNALLYGTLRTGKPHAAMKILEQIKLHHNIAPDDYTTLIIVLNWLSVGDVDQAMQVIETFLNEGTKIHRTAMDRVIYYLCRDGKLEQAEKLAQLWEQKSPLPERAQKTLEAARFGKGVPPANEEEGEDSMQAIRATEPGEVTEAMGPTEGMAPSEAMERTEAETPVNAEIEDVQAVGTTKWERPTTEGKQ